MENLEIVDFWVLDEIIVDEWEKGFEKEIDGFLFNINIGFLWWVRLLKELVYEGKYNYVLLFIF